MARPATTYRVARRNHVFRELGSVWSPGWYFSRHDKMAAKIESGGPYRPKQPSSGGAMFSGALAAVARGFMAPISLLRPRARSASRGR